MSDTAVIKEFLVKLGFEHDEKSLKKFTGGVETATSKVLKMAVAIHGVALTIGAGVTAFASKLEGLYYAAVKTGSSAKNLQAFGTAVANLGGNAESALQSVQGLARWMRETPGSEGFLKSLGVNTRNANGELRDTTDILADLGAELAKKPYAQSKMYADMLGADEDTFRALINGDFEHELKKQRSLLKDSGFDDAAKSSHDFMVMVRELKTYLQIFAVEVQKALVEKLGGSMEGLATWARENLPGIAKRVADLLITILTLAEKMTPAIGWLVDKFIELDEATDGWSTKLIILMGVLNMLGAGGLISGVMGLAGALGSLAVPILAIAGALGGGYALGTGLNALIDMAVSKLTGKEGNTLGSWIYDLTHDDDKMEAPKEPSIRPRRRQGVQKTTVVAELEKDEPAAQVVAIVKNKDKQKPGTVKNREIQKPGNDKKPSELAQNEKRQEPRFKKIKYTPVRQTNNRVGNKQSNLDPINFFTGLGWTKEQAAGIVANLRHESQLDHKAVGDGGKAYGIAQWHPDRQANFEKWAGKDIRQSTQQEQMAFVHYELTQGAEQKAGRLLRASNNARQAGEVVSRHYERPMRADAEAKKRGETAVNIAQTTNINVNGGDAVATGRAVASEQERVAASMTRNLNTALN